MKTIKIIGSDTFMKAGLIQTVRSWNEAVIIEACAAEAYAALLKTVSAGEKQLHSRQSVLYLIDVQLVLDNPQKFSGLTYLLQSGCRVVFYGDFRQNSKKTDTLLALGAYACICRDSPPSGFLSLLDGWYKAQQNNSDSLHKKENMRKIPVYHNLLHRFEPVNRAAHAETAEETGEAPVRTYGGYRTGRMTHIRSSSLSPREREVAQLISSGFTTKEIAFELGISANTVESYKKRIMGKLHARSIADITRYAVQTGINSL